MVLQEHSVHMGWGHMGQSQWAQLVAVDDTQSVHCQCILADMSKVVSGF